MKKAFLPLVVLCCIGLIAGCNKESDYSELIIGEWLTEYGYIEKFNDQGVCIGTERREQQGDRFVTEFSSDGKVNSYKYGEEPTSDNQNRTYHIDGKQLIIQSHPYDNTEFTSTLDINVLNKKTLDISSDVHVSDYDSPEPPQDPDVRTQRHHTVFKRL